MPFAWMATEYSEGVKKFATNLETMTAIIMGAKILMEEVVSSMITTSE